MVETDEDGLGPSATPAWGPRFGFALAVRMCISHSSIGGVVSDSIRFIPASNTCDAWHRVFEFSPRPGDSQDTHLPVGSLGGGFIGHLRRRASRPHPLAASWCPPGHSPPCPGLGGGFIGHLRRWTSPAYRSPRPDTSPGHSGLWRAPRRRVHQRPATLSVAFVISPPPRFPFVLEGHLTGVSSGAVRPLQATA